MDSTTLSTEVKLPGSGGSGTFTLTGDPDLVRMALAKAIEAAQSVAGEYMQLEHVKRNHGLIQPCHGCGDK